MNKRWISKTLAILLAAGTIAPLLQNSFPFYKDSMAAVSAESESAVKLDSDVLSNLEYIRAFIQIPCESLDGIYLFSN